MIIPLLILAVVFIIFLGFYLYNTCILHQVAYTAALRGSLVKEGNNAQIEAYTHRELEKLIEGRLLAVKGWEGQVRVSGSRVKVELSMDVYIPVGGWLLEKTGLWVFQTNAEARRLEPVSIIRTIRAFTGG